VSIELLVLDVDGVLTDNTFLLHGESGEWKAFCAADGFGLRKLQDAGVAVAFLSGRNSPVVERRGRELGIALVVQGKSDKRTQFPAVCEQLGVACRSAAYMGDDLVDLPALRMAGFSAAPCNARPEVSSRATSIEIPPALFRPVHAALVAAVVPCRRYTCGALAAAARPHRYRGCGDPVP